VIPNLSPAILDASNTILTPRLENPVPGSSQFKRRVPTMEANPRDQKARNTPLNLGIGLPNTLVGVSLGIGLATSLVLRTNL